MSPWLEKKSDYSDKVLTITIADGTKKEVPVGIVLIKSKYVTGCILTVSGRVCSNRDYGTLIWPSRSFETQ